MGYLPLLYYRMKSIFAVRRAWRHEAKAHVKTFTFDKSKAHLSFSHEGEDRLVMRLLENKKNGFYVDIGAHHPFKYSNTAIFYDQGWRGINIDPNPNTLTLFNAYRKSDINVQCGVGTEGYLTYYVYKNGAINTFDDNLVKYWRDQQSIHPINSIQVKIRGLASILDQYLNDHTIDFMNIDTEGFEMQVIESNDWSRFRPRLILLESLSSAGSIQEALDTKEIQFLITKGYSVISKCLNTIILFENKEDFRSL